MRTIEQCRILLSNHLRVLKPGGLMYIFDSILPQGVVRFNWDKDQASNISAFTR